MKIGIKRTRSSVWITFFFIELVKWDTCYMIRLFKDRGYSFEFNPYFLRGGKRLQRNVLKIYFKGHFFRLKEKIDGE